MEQEMCVYCWGNLERSTGVCLTCGRKQPQQAASSTAPQPTTQAATSQVLPRTRLGKKTMALRIGGLILSLLLVSGGWLLFVKVLPSFTHWDALSPDQQNSYLQTYADLSKYQTAPPGTFPYVRPKVFPVSMSDDTRGFPYKGLFLARDAALDAALPPALDSQSASDVGTILLLHYGSQVVNTASYSLYKGGPTDCVINLIRTDINLTLIDYNKGLILFQQTFTGDEPTAPAITLNCQDITGDPPIDQVAQFVTNLPQQ